MTLDQDILTFKALYELSKTFGMGLDVKHGINTILI
jgi:hypothetical protein